MNFILMAAMSLVPLFLGTSSKMVFKTKLTNAMFVFMIFISLWQLDVSVLYSIDLFHEETIFFLFRLLRIGSIMLPPAFLYVGYMALKYLSRAERSWMQWIINKYTLCMYYCWSVFIYIINWTDLGVTGLNTIAGVGSSNVVLFPQYGEWGFLFANHIKLLIVSILLTLIVSRKVVDKYVKIFLTSFSSAFLITYVVGVMNLHETTFIYSSQIAVMIFSVFVFFIFTYINTKMIRETNQIIKRKEQEKQVEISTSGLIHEIKNPLTIVKGYSDILAGNDELNTKVKDMVTQIQVAGSHMNSVITHYEQFIKSGKIHASETEIMEIIKEALVLTSLKTNENNVHIDLIEENQLAATIDKDKIRQVFINLINNSIEAMEEKEHKSITIRTSSNNNEIHILFADNGSGIPKEAWSKIFTPFHSTKEAGMGLGLPICQRIVNSHGGYIEITRSSEEGTEIRVTLPKYVMSGLLVVRLGGDVFGSNYGLSPTKIRTKAV